jgi:hypothetical protein
LTKLVHKYELWAWAYPEKLVRGMDGTGCMTWKKTIYRVNPIIPKQSDKLLMNFCSKIMEKWNCSIGLDGINYLGIVAK